MTTITVWLMFLTSTGGNYQTQAEAKYPTKAECLRVGKAAQTQAAGYIPRYSSYVCEQATILKTW